MYVVLQGDHTYFQNVRARPANAFQQLRARLLLEVDAGNRRLCAFEDDVLHLLHIDLGSADRIQYAGENAEPILNKEPLVYEEVKLATRSYK